MAKSDPIEVIRNIGISAHIDSGKTTLTERILFYTGNIHKIREVRGGDGGAKMDSMDLEREKGITIQSAATYVRWKDIQVNIIDTPGHVDFTVEVERALRVLDGAILVLCGASGVQSQSITVDRQMKRYNVPCLAFINKMDRAGANAFKVVQQLREKLNHNAALISYPIGAEDDFAGSVDLVSMEKITFEGDAGENDTRTPCPPELLEECTAKRNEMIEILADFDDALAEKYLEGKEITAEELRPVIRKAVLERKFTPVFVGSAYKNKGVQPLLDGVASFLPNPTEVENRGLDQKENEKEIVIASDDTKPFVGLAFKLEDGKYGQLTYLRVYSGKFNKGDFIYNINNNGKKVKVSRLVRMHSDEMHDADSAKAGDIIALFGVECASGDTFTDGSIEVTMTSMHVPAPVISLAVSPKSNDNQAQFGKALNRFTKEDPTFRVRRDEESGETLISGMGELHLEIYVERMKREYKCEVAVGQPQVAYRETITQKADMDYTHKKQTGGAGQFARVSGFIEPLPAEEEKNYVFENKVVGGSIPKEYISACDKGFQDQLQKGLLIGAPVINVGVELNDGAYHAVDSSEMAFRLCSMAAMRETYQKAGPIILEPIMKVDVSVPEEYQGSVIGGLNQRRGAILDTQSDDGFVAITATVPFSEMFGYATDLRSATQGKGEFTMEFEKYESVPKSIQAKLQKEVAEKKAQEAAAKK